VQNRLVAEKRSGYRFTSAELRAKWEREGQRPTGAVGAFEFVGRGVAGARSLERPGVGAVAVASLDGG
jgi:hypothetical protein